MMVGGVYGWGWVVYGQMFSNVLTFSGLRTAKALILQECSDVRFFSKNVYTSQKPPLLPCDLRTCGGQLRSGMYKLHLAKFANICLFSMG